jgi:hypothetical protein
LREDSTRDAHSCKNKLASTYTSSIAKGIEAFSKVETCDEGGVGWRSWMNRRGVIYEKEYATIRSYLEGREVQNDEVVGAALKSIEEAVLWCKSKI